MTKAFTQADEALHITLPGFALELCAIPAGLLRCGSESGRDDERPVRDISIDAFRLGRTQVTNAQYDRFVEATAHETAPFRAEPAFSAPD
ncbi:MAG: SUMF1/EgtB/PvdO family nonheme iron enzyme, partial [Thermoanaerobaculia bacterium]